MLSIGQFAMHGQVSVRMLRHYDALGLLVPTTVDPHSGYRYYAPAQLARLNRIVSLKSLGFTLAQIGPVLDAEISAAELRAMLLMRRAQLEQQLADDRAALDAVERRLRMIEEENLMSDHQFVEKPLPAVTLLHVTVTVEDLSDVGGVVGPMFGQLMSAAGAGTGVPVTGPGVAWYDGAPGGAMTVGVGVPVVDGTVVPAGLVGGAVANLPAVDRAVTLVHQGDMSTISQSWQTLMRYCGAAGLSPAGLCREVYLSTPMDRPDAWVTELQQPVE